LAVEGDSYARALDALNVSTLDGASPVALAPFASASFTYYGPSDPNAGKVASQTLQGQGTTTYSYAPNPSIGTGTNAWAYKTVETAMANGTVQAVHTVYANSDGEVLLDDTIAKNALGNSLDWRNVYVYDSDGRLIEQASPSAVSSAALNESLGNPATLNPTSGLIAVSKYYPDSTAPSSAGGYLEWSGVQQGSAGTPIVQDSYQYVELPNDDGYLLSSSTVYRSPVGGSLANATNAATTTYAYTFSPLSSSVPALSPMADHVSAETRTLPAASNSQNGDSTTAAQVTTTYDSLGNPVWQKDADGYISYTAYDRLCLDPIEVRRLFGSAISLDGVSAG
jgi:hypothetical protein